MNNRKNLEGIISCRIKKLINKNSSENSVVDIAEAIETVENFALSNDTQSFPSLGNFEVEGQTLHVQSKTTLEKTIAFTKDCLIRAFSQEKRKAQEIRRKAIEGTLTRSRDMVNLMINLYSSPQQEMQDQTREELTLAERIFHAAERYNEVIRQARKDPDTISQKIKKFFFGVAGWELNDEIVGKEIVIPRSTYLKTRPSANESIHIHKITPLVKDRTTLKIASIIQSGHVLTEYERSLPKLWEIDCFKMKALSLISNFALLQELPYEQKISLIRTHLIEICETCGNDADETTTVTLKQTIVASPGLEIEVKGSFERDPLTPHLSKPIKKSFQLSQNPSQISFPDPLQYTGFTFNDILLPSALHDTKKYPHLENLLNKRKKVVQSYLSEHESYIKSKEVFASTRRVYIQFQKLFLSLAKDLAFAWVGSFDKKLLDETQNGCIHALFTELEKTANGIEKLADLHRKLINYYFVAPLKEVLKNTLCQSHSFEEIQAVSYQAIKRKIVEEEAILATATSSQRQEIAWISRLYRIIVAKTFSHAFATIFAWARSLEYALPISSLNPFETKVLVSFLRQQIVFTHGCSKLQPAQDAELFEILRTHFHEELSIYQGIGMASKETELSQKIIDEIT
jgi:hypothetical protein